MTNERRYFFLLLFIFIALSGFTQYSVKGWVKQDSSDIVLAKVHVSIPELSIITLTDSSGFFHFDNIPYGNYFLMFKNGGYKTKIIHVKVIDNINLETLYLKPSFNEVPEVVIYGTNNSDLLKTANTISQLNQVDMRNSGALNLSDGISKLPGVSQLSTGAGISKPVIRGLFGNRIQTVLYGLRFDNQQWQDEHGLGLSDVGIDRVEVIKGAASLLYGSEAMGGVINIIEEKTAPINQVTSDISFRCFSNTYGTAMDAGVKGAKEKFNWRFRTGFDSHADYSDGNNKRILNSRFGGYYIKTGFGFNRKNWISQNNYMLTQNNFGFLMDTVQLKDAPDNRLSRGFDRPHHTVDLNIISSQNTFFLQHSKLKLNLGFQNNERMEQEGGSKISLDMILRSSVANIIWTRTFNDLELSIGSQGYYQTNKNVGSRMIIPDAKQIECSGYTYLKYTLKKIVFEGGLRYDFRHIETDATGSINTDPLSPGFMIKPFSNDYNSVNGSIGFSWFSAKHFHIKSNFSSGYRAGNLAELSSNGLHEGTVRYEIGNIDLKIEQNICGDLNLFYTSEFIDLSASAYYNQFLNYIYLAPSNQQYIGYSIFYYEQQDALIKGIESNMSIHPAQWHWFNWTSSYSYIIGNLGSGNNLPFIPAPKLNSDIKLTQKVNKKITELYFKPGISYVFDQNRPGDFETNTSAYYLVNASAGLIFDSPKNLLSLSLVGNNLLNNAYYDHLSRFKYFGIYNVGRNISLNFKITFK